MTRETKQKIGAAMIVIPLLLMFSIIFVADPRGMLIALGAAVYVVAAIMLLNS